VKNGYEIRPLGFDWVRGGFAVWGAATETAPDYMAAVQQAIAANGKRPSHPLIVMDKAKGEPLAIVWGQRLFESYGDSYESEGA
jgi:hypothetical protein